MLFSCVKISFFLQKLIWHLFGGQIIKFKIFCVYYHAAIGFTNGSVRIVDGLTLKEEGRGDGLAVFNHCHDCITNIKFSHDSNYLATSVSNHMTLI